MSLRPRLCADTYPRQGANMMAPGLLSTGGDLPPGLAANTVVAIHAEGKESAAGIGKLTASSEELVKAGKGIAVEVMSYLGCVWRTRRRRIIR
jgi:PUA domain protein